MTREEAIAIAHSDPQLIVEALLSLSARIAELEHKIALLTRDSSNSSKPPSCQEIQESQAGWTTGTQGHEQKSGSHGGSGLASRCISLLV